MTSRSARAMRALDALYDTEPAHARALDQYVADLRAEAGRYRRRAQEAEAAYERALTRAAVTRQTQTRPTQPGGPNNTKEQ